MESDSRVSIDFMGKTHQVSKDLSLLGALLEIGWDSVKGLGCMGGCCGGCGGIQGAEPSSDDPGGQIDYRGAGREGALCRARLRHVGAIRQQEARRCAG